MKKLAQINIQRITKIDKQKMLTDQIKMMQQQMKRI